MGKNKLARSLELETDVSKDLFDQYDRRVPYCKTIWPIVYRGAHS